MAEIKLKVLTIPQAAERCKEEGIPLGVSALRRLVRGKRLPATFIGRKAFIRWEDILNFFAHPEVMENGS